MKSLILIAALVTASSSFAETRKPASLESELLQAYMKTADLLAQARAENKVCEHDAYQSTLITTLESARNLPGFNPNMISPAVKTALAGTIIIKEILGEVNLDYNASESTYQKALTGTNFESNASGAYGPGETFELKANGVIEVSRLQVLDEEPWTKHTKHLGRWGVKLKDGVARVWFTVGKKTRTYRLERSYDPSDNRWNLKNKEKASDANAYRTRFYNGVNSECEA